MKYMWNSLTPEDYRTYRLARFGEAGRCGNKGVAAAAEKHGVKVRAWYTYESGSRQPDLSVRGAVARWLNQAVRRAKPTAANVEVSLGRPAPLPLPVEESTTRTEVPAT